MSLDLGDDEVKLERIDAVEALSMPFSVAVDILAPLELDLHPHMGKPCSLKVFEDGRFLRHFHGLLVEGEYAGESPEGHSYHLTLRPWTYFLGQNRQMRIFQDKDVVAIIREVLLANSISDVEYRLSRSYVKRIYCVQYRESDFAFLSRLMEEEGIYYYFRHDADKHVLVLCDAKEAHPRATPAELTFNPQTVSVFQTDSSERGSQRHYLQSWTERVVTTGEAKFTGRDFHFQASTKKLEQVDDGGSAHARDDREVFDYPVGFLAFETELADSTRAARDRMKTLTEAARAHRCVFTGTSQSTGLANGAKVTVQEHPSDRMNGEYLIVWTHHSVTAESYRSGRKQGEASYNVRFEAIPADTQFRPARITPRPLVQGLESAVVTGPDGETIYTDEFGRVKVKFHWDRDDADPGATSCWIRVSQTGSLGNTILPRVGHEVLIDFLGGDPDRPVIVGRVFNDKNMPAYKLPDHRTRAVWRTLRYGKPGQYPDTKPVETNHGGVNEICLEDKGGSEEFYMYAERNMRTRIRFDESHHLGHNQDLSVGWDQTMWIGRDRKEQVVRDENVLIGRDRVAHVKQDESMKVGRDQVEEVGRNRNVTVKADDKLDVTRSITVTAGSSITIKVGGSSIKIDGQGITITAPNVKVKGNALANVEAPMTTVKGNATLVLQGGVVKIN